MNASNMKLTVLTKKILRRLSLLFEENQIFVDVQSLNTLKLLKVTQEKSFLTQL